MTIRSRLAATLVWLGIQCGAFCQTTPTHLNKEFSVEGKIISPWDALPDDTVIQQDRLVFDGHQPMTTADPNAHVSYVRIPRAEVTFEGKSANKTVVVDRYGFYTVDLPLGEYEMTAKGPTISPQALTVYRRLFRVNSPSTITLDGTLQKARMNCDAVTDMSTTEASNEAMKNMCGGEDFFSIRSNGGSALQVWISYPRREATQHGYSYMTDNNDQSSFRVFVAYNLFSLEASDVEFDVETHTIKARGNVIASDGHGKTEHLNSVAVKIENGQIRRMNSKSFVLWTSYCGLTRLLVG